MENLYLARLHNLTALMTHLWHPCIIPRQHRYLTPPPPFFFSFLTNSSQLTTSTTHKHKHILLISQTQTHTMTDIIGTDSTNFRTLPGAEKATSGHTYIVADPSTQTQTSDDGQGEWKTAGAGGRQIEEHLPAPTGIDRPPNEKSSVAASAGERLSGGGGQSLQGNTNTSGSTAQPVKNVQRPSGAQMGELDQAASALLSNTGSGANSANCTYLPS